ncbi:MAG: S16 family serine protease, partial [Eubacteriales bacterium]
GVDYNRLYLILAVLEKRLGLKFYQNDVYLNVIGGLSIGEPAADLAMATSLISSLTDRVVPDELIVIGELGLAGEVRSVSNLEQRVHEAARLGFTRAIVPFRNVEKRPMKIQGVEVIPVRSVYEILKTLKTQS